jgi:hypothetical protein
MVIDDRIENCDVIYRGHEVKEALRAQMEVQSKLHLLVEVNFLFLLHNVLLFWLYSIYVVFGFIVAFVEFFLFLFTCHFQISIQHLLLFCR